MYQADCKDCGYTAEFAKESSADRAQYQHAGETAHNVMVDEVVGESTGVQDL